MQQMKAKNPKDSSLDWEENQEKTEETGNPEQEAKIPNLEEGSS